jgi:hypothetical protein
MPSQDSDGTDFSVEPIKSRITRKPPVTKIKALVGPTKTVAAGKHKTPIVINPTLAQAVPSGQGGDGTRYEHQTAPEGFKKRLTIHEINARFVERFKEPTDPELVEALGQAFDEITEDSGPSLPKSANYVKQLPMGMVKRKLEVEPFVRPVPVVTSTRTKQSAPKKDQDPTSPTFQTQDIIQ